MRPWCIIRSEAPPDDGGYEDLVARNRTGPTGPREMRSARRSEASGRPSTGEVSQGARRDPRGLVCRNAIFHQANNGSPKKSNEKNEAEVAFGEADANFCIKASGLYRFA